jgi:bifunctional non-homologous end joining protein LigD
MLAKKGQPFDDPRFLFEIKWDGCRMLAFVEQGSYRLVNRHGALAPYRYPELAFLAGLPPGTILDGEMVVLRGGKPDLALLQARDQTRSPWKIRSLSRSLPAAYVVFDLLYEGFQPLLKLPLCHRRQRLQGLVQACGQSSLVMSQGVVGSGLAFFQEVCRLCLEGMVAKRLDSFYQPGKRSDAWLKIKLPKCYPPVGS